MVDSVLAEAGKDLKFVELIVVGMGPGSFTGVRVGMAAAKGLSMALGIPGVGVVSLEAMAYAAREIVGRRHVVAMLDAKKGEVFVACYTSDGELVAGPSHVCRDGVASWVGMGAELVAGISGSANPKLVVVGDVVRDLGLRGVEVISSLDCDLPGAQAMVSLGLLKRSNGCVDDIGTMEPQYVRPPDITQPRV